MKRTIYKLTLLLLIIPGICCATTEQPPNYERSKTVKKSYVVKSDATVEIQNKYGNVNIVTWDKNDVEIIVEITVKGDNLKAVENQLKSVSIGFDNSADNVSAQTKFGTYSKSWNLWSSSNKIGYTVNYTVKMPLSNNLRVQNDYGAILLNEIDGTTNINCDYGKISLGALNNAKNTINIDYTKNSSIEFMKAGAVNADYSELRIEKTGTVKINSDYATIEVGDAVIATFNSDYGNMKIDNVSTITGNTDYVNIRLGTVRDLLTLKSDYGAIKIQRLATGFQRAEIIGAYTGITIGLQENSNFTFSAELQYAGLRCNRNKVDMRKSIEKSTRKFYEGTYGKGNSNAILKIQSKYGSVRFEEE